MRNRLVRKKLLVLYAIIAMVTLLPLTVFAADDISGHWAKEAMTKWSSQGLIKGYSDGTLKPDNNITRAEFFALVNKVFAYKEQATINFSDVSRADWYYDEVAKAVAAGYVAGYPDGSIKPQAYITRQEASVVVAKAFGLQNITAGEIAEFKDSNGIHKWASDSVAMMKMKGFINGYPDGTFGPAKNIKRAETVIILDKASGQIINQTGILNKDVQGNLVVNVTGVTLKDMTIMGDLYLAEGIGDGEVVLDGVTVKGRTLVRGGGENSIILKNSTLNDLIINKTRGSGQQLRVVSEGSTDVSGTVTVNSGVKLEETNVNQGVTGFNKVVVSALLPANARVQFAGSFGEVTVEAPKGIVEIFRGATVPTVTMKGSARLIIAEGAKVTSVAVASTAEGVIIEAKAEVKIVVNAANVTVNNTAVASGSTANVSAGGTVTTTTSTTTTTTTGSSGGGGGGGSDTSIGVSLSVPVDGIIPYHFDAVVKKAQTDEVITGLTVADFSLRKGQVAIPLNGEAFHEWLSDDPMYNVPGRYTIYPTDEYRPMDGEYILSFSKTGYNTASVTFQVVEPTVDPDVELTSLTLSGVPSNFTFASSTYNYEGVTVPNSQASITVTPTLEGATIKVNETEVASGQASEPIDLVAGTETIINVEVTKTGFITKNYVVKVTRSIPVWSDGGATEGSITLNPMGAEDIIYGPETGVHTINGDLSVAGDNSGQITLRNISISGNLVVNTPNATVNVEANVTVTGDTSIVAVSPETFNSEGSHNGVIDVVGSAALNLSGNASQALVQINTNNPVILKGNINLVRVLIEEAVLYIENGTVNSIQVEANNTEINNIGGSLSKLLVKETINEPVTTGTIPQSMQLLSGLTNVLLTIEDSPNNSNSVILNENETLEASSLTESVATVTVGGASLNEVQVTAVEVGRSIIEVRVKNSSDQIIKAGTFMVTVAPTAPNARDIEISQPNSNEAVGQTKITIASTLEFRITNADRNLVKQNWTPGTGIARVTQANPQLVSGDIIEVRVKAVALNPASDTYQYTVQQEDIGEVDNTALIYGANVRITVGSAVFNYEFYDGDQSQVTYEEALGTPYNLNVNTSTVRLEKWSGEQVSHETGEIPLASLNLTSAGTATYTDLSAVENAFGNPDFINVWQGAPTHIILNLKGGLGEEAWELEPITIQFGTSDLEAFGTIMSPTGGGSNPADFLPGEGGALPNFTPFSMTPGKIGLLYVERSHRENNFMGGNRAVVDFKFSAPWEIGATSYTLQYSSDNGSTWQNYQSNSEDVITSSDLQDNFSLSPNGNYNYRLLVVGGEYDRYTSNEVNAELSAVETNFSAWGLDESMWITGIISPYVGSGKEASFVVISLSDGNEIVGSVTYQWYRVNPLSFELTPIPAANGLTYITTTDDAGYYILCRATGDGVNVGGFTQIISYWAPEIPNKAFVSNITPTGFRLNLYKSVAGLSSEDLELNYYDEQFQLVDVPINSVTHIENNSVFDIMVNMPMGVESLSLSNTSPFWRLVSEMEGHMMMGGIEIILSPPNE